MIFMGVCLLIVGGISYSYYSAPEQPSVQIVDKALNEFMQLAIPLEQTFFETQSITNIDKSLSVNLPSDPNSYLVTMQVVSNKVLLTFPDNATLIAGQTVLMEPQIKDNKVLWKCINGSLLVRLRPRDCRLGNGLSRHSRFD